MIQSINQYLRVTLEVALLTMLSSLVSCFKNTGRIILDNIYRSLVSHCRTLTVFVSLCQSMSVYVSLCQSMPVYVSLC